MGAGIDHLHVPALVDTFHSNWPAGVRYLRSAKTQLLFSFAACDMRLETCTVGRWRFHGYTAFLQYDPWSLRFLTQVGAWDAAFMLYVPLSCVCVIVWGGRLCWLSGWLHESTCYSCHVAVWGPAGPLRAPQGAQKGALDFHPHMSHSVAAFPLRSHWKWSCNSRTSQTSSTPKTDGSLDTEFSRRWAPCLNNEVCHGQKW